jgi:hypothetical protein
LIRDHVKYQLYLHRFGVAKVLLYHYTFEKHLSSIQKEGLRPSIRIEGLSTSDAQHGDGHYLTDLSPEIAEQFSRPQVSQALFKLPRKWGLTGKLQNIGYLAFDMDKKHITRVHDLFASQVQKQYPNLGIWLHPSTKLLAVKYIVESGLIRFKAMPSSNQ